MVSRPSACVAFQPMVLTAIAPPTPPPGPTPPEDVPERPVEVPACARASTIDVSPAWTSTSPASVVVIALLATNALTAPSTLLLT